MDSKVYKTILRTVCYADIFDYPLTEEEVYRWFFPSVILSRAEGEAKNLEQHIRRANSVIVHKGKFMFLKGKEHLLAKRQERELISNRKLAIAKRVVKILKIVPTIKLIGVSGSVAMNNAKAHDDIDFFIVTSSNSLWITRLLTTIVVELFGKRRRPADTNVTDKICLNMFVDEKFLSMPKQKRNLYTAHEICQLKVLYDQDTTYSKFLAANMWVSKFLPNALLMINDERLKIKESKRNSLIRNQKSLNVLELIAKKIQLWYMRRHQTSEVVTDHYLAFHPKDHTRDILAAYREKLTFYGSQV